MANNRVRKELTHDDQVARITLARPKANILDCATMLELREILRELAACEDLKAIVVGSEGPHFSFGASIEEHMPEYIQETLGVLGALLEELLLMPAPTIAAVRGQCLGGAFELALACDLVVAAENAQFGLPEIKLGVFPPAGAALLPVRIGASRSTALILTGQSRSAASALAAGVVHQVVRESELDTYINERVGGSRFPSPLRSGAALRGQGCARPAPARLENRPSRTGEDLPGRTDATP